MSDPRDILTSRGLTSEVIEARGYVRYESADDVLGADPRMGAADMIKWTKYYGPRGPGWVMPKWKLPGSRFNRPLPQLRPDTTIKNHSKRYVHEHDTDPFFVGAPLDRTRHEDKYHGGEDDPPVDGEHRHTPESKYLIAPGPHAKRWDSNPRCADRWASAERVFLHLEGCIKADALAAVGEAAADVPSVTLWDRADALSWADWPGGEPTEPQPDFSRGFWESQTPEHEQDGKAYKAEIEAIRQLQQEDLSTFLAEHVHAPVIVVCDSDWRYNARVATEAFNLRDLVRQATDLPCVVAAPPTGKGGKKQGTDDYLADRRHKVGGHLVIEPVESPEFVAWARDYERRRKNDGRVVQAVLDREIEVMRWYATRAITETGKVERGAKALARHFGVDSETIRRDTVRLIDAGALDPVGHYPDPDAKHEKRRKPKPKQTKGGYASRQEPSGLIVSEHLRPATPAVRLDAYLRQL